MNLFSRYVESVYQNLEVPGGLSKGRLNHRAFDVKKVPEGVEFSIVRHPYAWSDPAQSFEVEQRWSFNIKTGELCLIREKTL